MAAQERLTVEQVRTPDLVSAHHLHRYEWAKVLCADARVIDLACGVGYGSDVLAAAARSVVGVDRDGEAITSARRHFERDGVHFEQQDAATYVRRPLDTEADMLVCFEGLEHFDTLPEVLESLRQLASRGMRMLLSFPNEDKFVEENHFHVQTFGLRDVQALADSLPDAHVLQQYLAEGSVVVPVTGTTPPTATARVVAPERLEPEYANHWLIASGFSNEEVAEASARLNVATSPNYNSYMRTLEKANAELYRLNLELQQGRLGQRDSAAAGIALKATQLQQEVKDLRWRYEEMKEYYSSPRYRVLDGIRRRALNIPGLSVSWWTLRRVVGVVRRTRTR